MQMVATALRKYISADTSIFALNINMSVHMKHSCYWHTLDIFAKFVHVHNLGPHLAEVWLSRLELHAFLTWALEASD